METLYVHLPFCPQKCKYCDFVSYAASFAEREAYLSLLTEEMALYRGLSSGLKTVYFGGGTPSLLTVKQWGRLMGSVEENFGLSKDLEMTLEANPNTIDAGYCRDLKSLGFNRISIGGQSFQDHHLKAMGRSHDSAAIVAAVAAAATAFDNIGLDLIYGLPGQTMAEWQESLTRAVALPLRHISTYGLKLGAATPWGREALAGALVLPEDDFNGEQQVFALEFLCASGFPHYEIANFAQKGYECRHNLAYWLGADYLGLGLNASSYLGGRRLRNHRDLLSYERAIQMRRRPIAEEEILGEEERRLEDLFLRFRLADGLSLAEIKKKYQLDFLVEKKGQMVKLLDEGLVEIENGQLKLTIKGIPLQNEVLLYLI